jgi:hypothetical protein
VKKEGGRKVFFFEKKNQKTFANASGVSGKPEAAGPPVTDNVFAFFFQKSRPSFRLIAVQPPWE